MLAMIPKNHPKHRRKRGGVDDSVDDRETPQDVFYPLDQEFHFTLDVCAARHNAKCRRYYARHPAPANDVVSDCRQLSLFPAEYVGDEDALGYDGLLQPWPANDVVWCNPPFSDIAPWVERAIYARCTVVMLVPANRTEQPWWQRYIEWSRDGRFPGGPITQFLDGRRCFKNRGQEITNRTSKNPPFGVCIIIWDRRKRKAPKRPPAQPRREK